MCGRYRLSRRKQIIEEYFDSVSEEQDWSPRYNKRSFLTKRMPSRIERCAPNNALWRLSQLR